MSNSRGRKVKLFIGLAVTLGFAWLLLRGLDLEVLWQSFARMTTPLLLPALAFLCTGWAIRIVRWWYMLRALEPELPLSACAGPFLAGAAINNVLPLRAGDAFRVFGFRRQLRAPAMRVLGTLIIERVLDVAVLLGILLLGLHGIPAGVFPQEFILMATWLAGLGIVAVLCLPLLAPVLGRVTIRFAGGQASRWLEAVSGHIANLIEVLVLIRSLPRLLILISLSVLGWACEGAVFVIVAMTVHAQVELPGPWFSLATGTLATAIPSAPGYIGTFDWFAAQGLAAYGAAPEIAAAFALTVHAVLWLPLTFAGLFYLVARGIPLRDIRLGS